jgi:hypothetical protein
MSETRESELRELIAKATRASTWSIEPHGGTTALYSGREDIIGEAFGHPMRGHGLRLMNLDDGDHNFAANGALIVAAVNALPGLLDELSALRVGLKKVEAERDEARKALERDRSIVIQATNAVRDELKGRAWLLEGGRGPYAWNDDRFRTEFSDALNAIAAPIEKLRDIGRDWSDCPTDHAAIMDARTDWKARAEAAERRLLPPALTEAQRGILAQAMCDANTGGGFWPHFDEQSRNPWFGITDRFHTLLSRIEKEGE